MASPSDGRQPQSNENSPPSCQIEQEQRQIVTPPRERGGYDCEFVERPKELEADCPICLLVLRDPFQASCCGNSFCQLCIKRVQADKKSCPTCNEADFSVFADKRLRRSLYAFQVRCVHQKSGCEWIGELGELERHLNLNPELSKQLVGCGFAAVSCTHCREYFQRRHVHAHETESCPQRPFSCDYCEDYGSVFEDVVTNHWPVCKCYPVSCPNECGVSPERQSVETHVNTVCPLTVVNCDFHYAGCEVQLVRKDMPTHLAESLVTHLSLLALHNQQLTQLSLQQKESLEELKKENEVLKQKDNKDVAREVAELEKRQLKIQELEREKQAQAAELQKYSETSNEEIEALKQKVNKDLKREVAELQRQREEDRTSLLQYMQRENKVLKEKVNKDVVREVGELKESLEKSQLKIQELEREKQALHNQQLTQLTLQLKERLEELKNESHQKIQELKKENEVLKQKVNKDVAKLKESLEKSQLKIQELEREKQAQAIGTTKSKHDIGALTVKVNEDLEREVAELRRQRDQDKVLLLHQCLSVFPIELIITNFAERKSSNRVWHSPPFYTHPQGYKMRLSVYANGYGKGKGTYVSVFAHLMRGKGACDDRLKWPFQGHVVLQLCNQLEDKRHCGHTISFSETTDPKAISRVAGQEIAESGWGTSTLLAHNDLNFNPANNCQYLKNDCLHFRIIAMESLSEPGELPTELTMTNFERHKTDSDRWFSLPLYTHPQGYKMCLSVYANGCGKGKGTHVSVFAYLMRGEFDDQLKWPFQDHVTVAMLNQLEDNHHTTRTIPFTKTSDNKIIGREERVASGFGYHTFIAHAGLTYDPAKNCQYLKYDCLRFRIVKVDKPKVDIPSDLVKCIKSKFEMK